MKLAWKNIQGRPGRSAALMIISCLISITIFTGTMIARSIECGTDSLKARLGADLIVIPAGSDDDVEALLVKGNPGYFYMDADNLDTVRSIEHVKGASPQLFLTTANTGCCAMPVQLIGFDPDSDFTVQPWISASYSDELADGDVLIGNNLTPEDDRSIRFYGIDCNVAGRLASSGTDFDNAVYTNMDTLRSLMLASEELGFNYLIDENAPDELISSIFIRVDDPANIPEVKKELSVKLNDVKVIRTSGMLTSTMENMSHLNGLIRLLIVFVWVLALVILAAAHIMLINERKKEFAIFRIAGASRQKVIGIILDEAVLIGLIGGALGILFGALTVFPFSGAYESLLGLPYLSPSPLTAGLIAAAGIIGTVISGLVAAVMVLPSVLVTDAGELIREGE